MNTQGIFVLPPMTAYTCTSLTVQQVLHMLGTAAGFSQPPV